MKIRKDKINNLRKIYKPFQQLKNKEDKILKWLKY